MSPSLWKGYSVATLTLSLSQYAWRASLSSGTSVFAASSFCAASTREQSSRILSSGVTKWRLREYASYDAGISLTAPYGKYRMKTIEHWRKTLAYFRHADVFHHLWYKAFTISQESQIC